MKRLLGLLLPLAALAGAPAGQRDPGNAIPVVDLRVGLARRATADGSVAEGVGQAGYVELAQGNVSGVVLPFPLRPDGSPATQDATSSFFALRTALDLSQRFVFDECGRRSERIATWFALDAPDELAHEPTLVDLWVARGVRVFAISGARDNDLATASTAVAPGPITGLSRAGREVVRRILAADALLDVSEASELSIDEVVELARAAHSPVIASHANARALADNPRNLGDAQIREIAATGGVIGVTAGHGMLAPGRTAGLRHLVRQILYLVRVAGADHVALGIGFESGVAPLTDFKSAVDFPRLAAALHDSGMRNEDVARVFSKNALRVLCVGRSVPPRARSAAANP